MAEEAGIVGEVSNKSGRRTGITQMALVDTPRDVMCQITGHRSASSLDKYDDSLLFKREAALRAIAPPVECNQGGSYTQLKDQVVSEIEQLQVEGSTPENSLALVPFKSTEVSLPASEAVPIRPIQQSICRIGPPSGIRQAGLYSGIGQVVSPISRHPSHDNYSQREYVDHDQELLSNAPVVQHDCVSACQIHCSFGSSSCGLPKFNQFSDRVVERAFVNVPEMRPVRNSYGDMPFHRPICKSVPPQFARTPSQILRNIDFLPTRRDKVYFAHRKESSGGFYVPSVGGGSHHPVGNFGPSFYEDIGPVFLNSGPEQGRNREPSHGGNVCHSHYQFHGGAPEGPLYGGSNFERADYGADPRAYCSVNSVVSNHYQSQRSGPEGPLYGGGNLGAAGYGGAYGNINSGVSNHYQTQRSGPEGPLYVGCDANPRVNASVNLELSNHYHSQRAVPEGTIHHRDLGSNQGPNNCGAQNPVIGGCNSGNLAAASEGGSPSAEGLSTAYDPYLDELILKYDLDAFERGKLVEKLAMPINSSSVNSELCDAIRSVGTVNKNTAGIAEDIQPKFESSSSASRPFGNVSHFVQVFNSGQQPDYGNLFGALFK